MLQTGRVFWRVHIGGLGHFSDAELAVLQRHISPQNQLRNPYSTERRRWDLAAVKSRLTGIKQVALCLAHPQQAASGPFTAEVKCVIYTLCH